MHFMERKVLSVFALAAFAVLSLSSTVYITSFGLRSSQITVLNDHNISESSNAQIKTKILPPLSTLVKNNGNEFKIKADISFLLDFAIVGHAKTGTSTVTKWLANHYEIEMYRNKENGKAGELNALTRGKPATFVREMYETLAQKSDNKAPQVLLGYKAPNDIVGRIPREMLQKYFPNTKLVIGLRHPIKWFESAYNFNARSGRLDKLPSLSKLSRSVWNTSAIGNAGKFHINLAFMGKTNVTEPSQRSLLEPYLADDEGLFEQNERERKTMPNRVFLYDVSQPFDLNETRNSAFREDLTAFLELSRLLERLKVRPPEKSKNLHYIMNICDDQYASFRTELTQFGRDASQWIRTYFLPLSDVTVSAPGHFDQLLEAWSKDPCLEHVTDD